jgi:hypothetical protein
MKRRILHNSVLWVHINPHSKIMQLCSVHRTRTLNMICTCRVILLIFSIMNYDNCIILLWGLIWTHKTVYACTNPRNWAVIYILCLYNLSISFILELFRKCDIYFFLHFIRSCLFLQILFKYKRIHSTKESPHVFYVTPHIFYVCLLILILTVK